MAALPTPESSVRYTYGVEVIVPSARNRYSTLRSAPLAATGTAVTKLDLHWSDPIRPTRTDVVWSLAGGHWGRAQNGQATSAANGPVVSPRHIVVLFVQYADTG